MFIIRSIFICSKLLVVDPSFPVDVEPIYISIPGSYCCSTVPVLEFISAYVPIAYVMTSNILIMKADTDPNVTRDSMLSSLTVLELIINYLYRLKFMKAL
jgi:hypothetical protein